MKERSLYLALVLVYLVPVWAVEYFPATDGPAHLAFPLAYSQLFQAGFYNFCLGLALLLFAVGVWWRQRDAPGLGLALRLNALLLLIWFSHLVAFFLTCAALGALWLITWRREGGGFRGRRHLLHLAILAPQAALPLWYLTTLEGDAALRWLPRKAVVLAQYLFQMGQVFSLHHRALRIGTVLSVAFLVFLALTVRGRLRGERRAWREEDAFLLAALLLTALYFVVPDGGVGGTQLKHRFALVPPLLLLPWLAPELGRRARAVAIAGLAVLVLVHAGFLLRWYRDADREIRTLVAGAADIAPGSRVLPLLFERSLPGWGGVLRHAFAHAAVEKELFDWSNYQAVTPHFPIRFRTGVRSPSLWIIQTRPGELDLQPYRDEIDYIYCWKLRPRSKIARRIEEDYMLVAERGPARVYARRED